MTFLLLGKEFSSSLRKFYSFLDCKKSQSFFYRYDRLALAFAIALLNLLFIDHVSASCEKCGGAIVAASKSDARTLIPILASDSASSQICGYLFNGIVKYDKNLNLVGDLAERWEISDDKLSITFYLKKNVFWHDGHPLTTDDVQFTYERLIDPETATPYSGDFVIIEAFDVIDKHTFRVTYKEPFAPGLASWGMSIIPKHLLKDHNLQKTEFRRKAIGSGPYRFKRWKSQELIELVYNNTYFEGRPYIARYFNRVIPDEAAIFIELQTKTIDNASISPIAYVFKTNTKFFKENFNKFRLPGFGYSYLGYNLERPLFSSKAIRIALDYAVDKQEIIKIIFFGLAKPITGPFIIDSWAYNPAIEPREFNPQKAREILEAEGWGDTNNDGFLDKDGFRFEFTITTNQGNDQRIKTAEIIQKRLKDIGVKVKIKVLEWSVFLSECIDKRNFEVVLLGWSLGLEPDPFDIWHSSKTKEGEFNFIGYRNNVVDDLLVRGRQTYNQEERKKIYHQFHKIIFSEQPYMFLYAPDSLVIVDKRFQGIDPGPGGIGHNFIRWWVEKNQRRYREVIQQ